MNPWPRVNLINSQDPFCSATRPLDIKPILNWTTCFLCIWRCNSAWCSCKAEKSFPFSFSFLAFSANRWKLLCTFFILFKHNYLIHCIILYSLCVCGGVQVQSVPPKVRARVCHPVVNGRIAIEDISKHSSSCEKKKKKDVFTNQENDGSVLFISHKHIQVKSVLDSFKMLFLPKCYRNICEFYD